MIKYGTHIVGPPVSTADFAAASSLEDAVICRTNLNSTSTTVNLQQILKRKNNQLK